MFKPLTRFQKFQAGSHLWLIFFEPHRFLFKEINWRTGFLLQSLNKAGKLISKPVLIDTQKVFPNQALLCLPPKKESWLFDIYDNWKQLNKPSLRVFTPFNCDERELKQKWPEPESFQDLSYYNEEMK